MQEANANRNKGKSVEKLSEKRERRKSKHKKSPTKHRKSVKPDTEDFNDSFLEDDKEEVKQPQLSNHESQPMGS